MIAPLLIAFDVNCASERAFDLWTSRLSTWWPSDHSVSGTAPLEVVLEGRIGGRIYERTATGEEHEWGTVTAWEPPTTVSYTWHLGADRSEETEVEVRFVPAGRSRTRVEIEHRGWERLGSAAAPRRDQNRNGWQAVITHFVEAIERGAR